MKEHYVTLQEHYKFIQEDKSILLEMKPQMEELAEQFINEFYNYIWDFGDTAKFLKNKKVIDYHKEKIRAWYVNLFSGNYDISYFLYLYKIGEVHVKIGLPTHYVNAAFTFVRTFIIQNLQTTSTDQERYNQQILAVEKIIDINLDILTSSYREEELSKYLAMSKSERMILSGLKRFTSYVNFLLAGALALVAFFAIGLFAYDIYLLFATNISMEKGILTILGSLLILWAAIELIHEEIKHLQGQGFAIGAFIMLAMAALIRKILIYSLSPEKSKELLIIGVVTVSLAVAYWLVGINKRAIID